MQIAEAKQNHLDRCSLLHSDTESKESGELVLTRVFIFHRLKEETAEGKRIARQQVLWAERAEKDAKEVSLHFHFTLFESDLSS